MQLSINVHSINGAQFMKPVFMCIVLMEPIDICINARTSHAIATNQYHLCVDILAKCNWVPAHAPSPLVELAMAPKIAPKRAQKLSMKTSKGAAAGLKAPLISIASM